MYDELIERLRRYLDEDDVSEDLRCAADAIEKLEAEILKLKSQLWTEYCEDMHEYNCPRIKELQADNDRLREMWAKAVSDLSKTVAKEAQKG